MVFHGNGGKPRQPGGRRARVAVCAWLITAAIGCGSQPAFEFDELDLVAAEEELEEFSLGDYTIPIPAAEKGAAAGASKQNRIQMDFELFALVSPHDKSKLSHAWERHEGMIRDRVIRVCRNSSLEVLHEPELGTLKAKLMDALAAHLGEDIHQLLITEVVTHEI
jgi:hypothetical protein